MDKSCTLSGVATRDHAALAALLQACRDDVRVLPEDPNQVPLQDHGRSFPPNYLHRSWRDYLYWDIELEP